MPLIKSRSKKAQKKNISELVKSKPGKARKKAIKTLAKKRGISEAEAKRVQAVAIAKNIR